MSGPADPRTFHDTALHVSALDVGAIGIVMRSEVCTVGYLPGGV
jgi:hypothetical protein